MNTAETVLKKFMRKKYCGGTRFDYLDDDEKEMIYAAMKAYAEFACEEQKRICSFQASKSSPFISEIDVNLILNAPLPDLK